MDAAPARTRYGMQVTESIRQTRIRYALLFAAALATPLLLSLIHI